jgi:ABC-type branched-subunit amino acid transport system substrate-binding protein
MVTWRVGVLFSRSGATAVSETEHFFGTALAIEELNNAGGVLGRPIEPVVYDPTSDPLTYRRYAERLLGDDGVNVIFGCSTSSCRKAVLPVVERRNGLLWYPSLYEGFEYSPNVIYTGAAPNQNSFQLSEYLIQNGGRHFYFIGTDYIYPRESNRIMRDLVESRGGEVVGEKYVPMVAGDDDLKAAVADIAARNPDVVFATIVGQSARRFYRMYSDAGFDRWRRPVASLTMVEGEIAAIGAQYCDGHIASATYFSTLDQPENRSFVKKFRARFGDSAPVSMWSEMAYSQVHLFAKALREAGTLQTELLVEAALGQSFEAPEGRIAIEPENHHTWLTPRIGVLRRDGEFDIVWQAKAVVRPDPYLAVTPRVDAWLAH